MHRSAAVAAGASTRGKARVLRRAPPFTTTVPWSFAAASLLLASVYRCVRSCSGVLTCVSATLPPPLPLHDTIVVDSTHTRSGHKPDRRVGQGECDGDYKSNTSFCPPSSVHRSRSLARKGRPKVLARVEGADLLTFCTGVVCPYGVPADIQNPLVFLACCYQRLHDICIACHLLPPGSLPEPAEPQQRAAQHQSHPCYLCFPINRPNNAFVADKAHIHAPCAGVRDGATTTLTNPRTLAGVGRPEILSPQFPVRLNPLVISCAAPIQSQSLVNKSGGKSLFLFSCPFFSLLQCVVSCFLLRRHVTCLYSPLLWLQSVHSHYIHSTHGPRQVLQPGCFLTTQHAVAESRLDGNLGQLRGLTRGL